MAEISVIITTCKRTPEMLKRAVDSVLAQTFEDFEVIVVDDSPSDFSQRDEVKSMMDAIGDKRICYVQHEENKGACAARNTGLNMASGSYVNFLDDDDEFMPSKLQLQYEAFAEHPETGLISCNSMLVNDTTGKETLRKKKTYNGMVFERMMEEDFIPLNCPLIRAECFKKCGGFNEELLSSQDYEMFLRLTKHYEVYVLQEPLVKIHLHGTGRITSNPVKKLQGSKKVIEIHKEYLEAHKRVYSLKLLEQVKYNIRLKDSKQAFQSFTEACKKYPLNTVYFLMATAFWMVKYRKG